MLIWELPVGNTLMQQRLYFSKRCTYFLFENQHARSNSGSVFSLIWNSKRVLSLSQENKTARWVEKNLVSRKISSDMKLEDKKQVGGR